LKIYRSRAPLRLGLGGGGSDIPAYSNRFGGHVLNTTIDKYVHVTLEPRSDDKITIISNDFNIMLECDGKKRLPYDGNMDLVKAVINRLREHVPHRIPGFNITIRADMPPGAGLGTSSTVVVAVIGAITEWLGIDMTELEIADLAYGIERIDMSLAGGKQDQYAAALGGFNFMEFLTDGKVIVSPLRIKPSIINELQENIMLCYTGLIHRSEDMIKAQTPNDEHMFCLMEHIDKLATEMRNCLLCGDLKCLGTLLSSEWDYKKQLSKEISNDTISTMENTALTNGAIGLKITGAGGGGLFIIYTDWKKRKCLSKAMQDVGGTMIDFSFTEKGLESWCTNNGA
jgi:D-glycero-alpha-D-manno-heptose-7-phosphate kinase